MCVAVNDKNGTSSTFSPCPKLLSGMGKCVVPNCESGRHFARAASFDCVTSQHVLLARETKDPLFSTFMQLKFNSTVS